MCPICSKSLYRKTFGKLFFCNFFKYLHHFAHQTKQFEGDISQIEFSRKAVCSPRCCLVKSLRKCSGTNRSFTFEEYGYPHAVILHLSHGFKLSYGYPHAVILHLSHGFKLSFKESWFLWGFQLFIWKIMNIWIHICVKHRKLCYIYEIVAKNAKKKGTFTTEKCTICQIFIFISLVNGTFFSGKCCIFCYNFINIA